MRRFGSRVFCGRIKLLLVQTLTSLTFKLFYIGLLLIHLNNTVVSFDMEEDCLIVKVFVYETSQLQSIHLSSSAGGPTRSPQCKLQRDVINKTVHISKSLLNFRWKTIIHTNIIKHTQ